MRSGGTSTAYCIPSLQWKSVRIPCTILPTSLSLVAQLGNVPLPCIANRVPSQFFLEHSKISMCNSTKKFPVPIPLPTPSARRVRVLLDSCHLVKTSPLGCPNLTHTTQWSDNSWETPIVTYVEREGMTIQNLLWERGNGWHIYPVQWDDPSLV